MVVALVAGAGLLLVLARVTRRGAEKVAAPRPVPLGSALEATPAPLPALVSPNVPEPEATRAPVVSSPAREEAEPEMRVLHGTVVWIDRAGVEHEEESGSFWLALDLRGTPGRSPVTVEGGRWSTEEALIPGMTFEPWVGSAFELGGRPATRIPVEGTQAEDGAIEFRVHEPARVRLQVRSSLDGRPLETILVREVSAELLVTDSVGERLRSGMGRFQTPLEIETRSGGFLRIGERMHADQRVEVRPDPPEQDVVLQAIGVLRVELDRGLAGAPGLTLNAYAGSGPARRFEGRPEFTFEHGTVVRLAPGEYTLEAVLDAGPDARLVGSARATVVAGEVQTVRVGPLPGEAAVEVEGTLELPAEWALDDFELVLALPATLAAGAEPEVRIPRKRMGVDRAGASLRRWQATLLPATYIAWLPATGYHTSVTIAPGARATPALELPRPCLLRVRCAADELAGCFRGLADDFRFALSFPRASDGSGFELRVPEGPWRLRARSGARTGELAVDARAPRFEVDLRVP